MLTRVAFLEARAGMGIFDTLRIAASGLTAQRLRMDVASSNIANADTTASPGGGPYRPEAVVFTPFELSGEPGAQGVSAAAIVQPGAGSREVYDPSNPAADAQGMVTYPDVDVAAQMADLIGASRSFQLDATVASAAKQSGLDALDIGR